LVKLCIEVVVFQVVVVSCPQNLSERALLANH